MDDKPIVVEGSPTPVQIEAGIRQTILLLGPVIGLVGATDLGKQLHINEAVAGLMAVIGPVSAIVAFIWGQYATRKHAKQAAVMADKLHNSIAVTK